MRSNRPAECENREAGLKVRLYTGLVVSVLLVSVAWPASAQTAVEATGGMAGFVDEAVSGHGVIGVGTRTYLTPRVSIGPELIYMRGPGNDRDLFLTGNVTYEFGRPNTAGRVVPFVVAGGGFMRHSDQFGPGPPFRSYEGAAFGGGGVRWYATDRLSLAGDWRIGWELHTRFAGLVAYSFGRR
jgi:hypothetical protein